MSPNTFIRLSEELHKYLTNQRTPYKELIDQSIEQAEIQNPWFIKKFVLTMLAHIQSLCSKESLEQYVADIPTLKHSKKILVIAAGNIPMVSFRDVMDVLLSRHYLVLKPSSKDTILMKTLLTILQDIQPSLREKIAILETNIKRSEIDAVIATGTNNTAMHIHHYFAGFPKIVRHNRTSVAIITEHTTDEDLKNLSHDVLLYFGLGCRNVSKIFLPKNFDIQRIFKSLIDYSFLMQHHKYMNNYDYYRSIYLLNEESFLENNFMILKESTALHAPVANLFYEYYDSINEVHNYIKNHLHEIQTIVGENQVPFGKAQYPSLHDFDDGINTKHFLWNI